MCQGTIKRLQYETQTRLCNNYLLDKCPHSWETRVTFGLPATHQPIEPRAYDDQTFEVSGDSLLSVVVHGRHALGATGKILEHPDVFKRKTSMNHQVQSIYIYSTVITYLV